MDELHQGFIMMYNALKTVSALSFEIYKFTPFYPRSKGVQKLIFNMSVLDIVIVILIIRTKGVKK